MTGVDNNDKERVVIVGAGLVGALAAIYMARLGYQVDVYEKRPDVRSERALPGRSINLALSERGLNALRQVGLEESVMQLAVPMRGRLLHSTKRGGGGEARIPYGLHGENVNSVSRRGLNEILLNAAERMSNVHFHFEHPVQSIDAERGLITVSGLQATKKATTTTTVQAAFILGCDGAYSAVRREMMKHTRLDFSQEYIEHGYKEFCIPADARGQWQMEHDYLHIWPCQRYMLIALPNPDGSFTATLFYPHSMFEALRTPADILALFRTNFADALQLIGEAELVYQFLHSPVGPLVTMRCSHYHVGDRLLLLGDAAHAMVPFYGQGMNAGFEDVFTLAALLEAYPAARRSQAFTLYSQRRRPDAHAICDLALYNYWEMSTGVISPVFRLKQWIVGWLHRLLPRYVLPLYTMVAFTNIPYSRVLAAHRRQERLIEASLVTAGLAIVGWAAYRLWGRR